MGSSVSRRMWQLLEPYHAIVYFAPKAQETYEAAGLKGGWMGYFASRSAAMGPVTAEVVHATFYNFHPAKVARAIPDAWKFASPERVLEARLEVANTALRDAIDVDREFEDIVSAAAIALRATDVCSAEGRPLFAAHAALPIPEEPHMKLWHAATCLREFRGDGHVNALVLHSVDGCEANVLMAAEGRFDAAVQRSFRGWSEEEWVNAEARLQARELIDEDGELTDRGRALRASIERQTDVLSSHPWEVLGPETTARLADSLNRLDKFIIDSGGVSYPNPMGLTRPDAGAVK